MSIVPMTALARLRSLWPDARAIRPAGRCPVCHRDRLYSFQVEDDHPRGDGEETCGYWCAACGWSNAGERERGENYED